MDTALQGPTMKEIVSLITDIATLGSPEGGNLGELIPAVGDLGARADSIREGLFSDYNLEDPPNEDMIVGFSYETERALEAHKEASRKLTGLILRDFGCEPGPNDPNAY
jgi:hypothetical protein